MVSQPWQTRVTVGPDGKPVSEYLRYILAAPNPFLPIPTTAGTPPQFPRYSEPLTATQRAALHMGLTANSRWFREHPEFRLDTGAWFAAPVDPLAEVRDQLTAWLFEYRPWADIPLPPTPPRPPVPVYGVYEYVRWDNPFEEEPEVAAQDNPTTPSDLDADWPHPRTLTVQVDGVTLSECSITGIKIERLLRACENEECPNHCAPTEHLVITADVDGPAPL